MFFSGIVHGEGSQEKDANQSFNGCRGFHIASLLARCAVCWGGSAPLHGVAWQTTVVALGLFKFKATLDLFPKPVFETVCISAIFFKILPSKVHDEGKD